MIPTSILIGQEIQDSQRITAQEFQEKLQNPEQILKILAASPRNSENFPEQMIREYMAQVEYSQQVELFCRSMFPEGKISLLAAQDNTITLWKLILASKGNTERFQFQLETMKKTIKSPIRTPRAPGDKIEYQEIPVGPDENAYAALQYVLESSQLSDSDVAGALANERQDTNILAMGSAQLNQGLNTQGADLIRRGISSTLPNRVRSRVTDIQQNGGSSTSRTSSANVEIPEIPKDQPRQLPPKSVASAITKEEYGKFEKGVEQRVKPIEAPLPAPQQQGVKKEIPTGIFKRSKKPLYWALGVSGGVIGGAAIASAASAFFSR